MKKKIKKILGYILLSPIIIFSLTILYGIITSIAIENLVIGLILIAILSSATLGIKLLTDK